MTESNETEDRGRWPTRRFEIAFWIVLALLLIALFWLFLGTGVNSPPG